MAWALFCNGRARAARGWIDARKPLIYLDFLGFARKFAGDVAAGDCHCVDTMSTQWRYGEVLSAGSWDLVFGVPEGNAGF